jgi:hypothetical protein
MTTHFPSSNGKIIVVRCDTCDVDYDVRDVTNEVQHPHALHVMSFDCPKGHHSEARRLWKEKALHITEGGVISLRCFKVLVMQPEEGDVKPGSNCNNDSCHQNVPRLCPSSSVGSA